MVTSAAFSGDDCPSEVVDFAGQAVAYVRRATGLELEFDSDTLPLLDHYLRTVPDDQTETVALVTAAAGCYFGEVIRRHLGGVWDLKTDSPLTWRMVLPGGLSFLPAAMAVQVTTRSEEGAADANLRVPAKMSPHIDAALASMAAVSEETYYSLCGKFDTLEHVQAVLLAIAGDRVDKSSITLETQ